MLGTLIFTTCYLLSAAVVHRAVHCAHVLGFGEPAPGWRAIKVGLLWPWYLATWLVQWLYMEVTK